MEVLSMRTRRRIMTLYGEGKQTQEIAQLVGASKACVRRIKQHFRERGTLEPRKPKVGRKQRITGEHQVRLIEIVHDRPDLTLEEIRDALGLDIHSTTVCRALKRLGLTLKKSPATPASRTVPTSRSGVPAGSAN